MTVDNLPAYIIPWVINIQGLFVCHEAAILYDFVLFLVDDYLSCLQLIFSLL